MNIFPTHSENLIKNILLNPEIFATISEDDATEGCIIIDPDDIYLVGLNDYGLIGLMIIENNGFIHIQVMPEFRKQFGREFAQGCLDWIWFNTEHDILYCSIPIIYQNVSAFAESFGFTKIKTISDDWRKNGAVHDSVIYELKRP